MEHKNRKIGEQMISIYDHIYKMLLINDMTAGTTPPLRPVLECKYIHSINVLKYTFELLYLSIFYSCYSTTFQKEIL